MFIIIGEVNMKKFTSIILSFCICLLLSNRIYASSSDNGFYSFFENALAHDSFYALDNQGSDISSFILELYNSKGEAAVYSYFLNHSGAVGYEEKTVSSFARSLEEAVTLNNYQYYTANGTYYGAKSWKTLLCGTYYYNTKTGLITRAPSPNLYLVEANFGTNFSPYLYPGTINSSISNQSSVTFFASYTMYADYKDEYSSGMGALKISYGSHVHRFTAS